MRERDREIKSGGGEREGERERGGGERERRVGRQ